MPVRRRSWQRGAPTGVLGTMGYTTLLSSRTHHNSTRRRRHHRNHHNKDTVVASTVENTPTVERQAREEQPGAPMRKEVSVCLRSMSPSHQATTMSRAATDSQLPLRVVLPPEKMADNKSSRLLTLDKDCNKKLNDSETTDDNNKTLNVEEFECGVSVAGSDKQEWSFTLYDFDGKGKITKEDLGSLLRSLYDAVGSSINLPKSGSKTLKLRLTVSPDTSKVAGSSRQTVEAHSHGSSRDKNNKTKESKLNKDLDNSKLSGKDLKLDNINNRTEQLNLEAIAGGAAHEAKVHHKEVKNNLSNPGKPVAAKPKLLTTVEQRHLAELVQKNMERHQQRQQQRHHQRARRDHRKHHSFNAGAGNNNISSTNNRSTIHTCEESRDRRNYYLDLAGIENDDPTKLLHNTSAPADLLSPRYGKRERDHRRDGKLRARSSHNARRQQHIAELQTSGAVAETGCDVAHQRSRSYDVPAEHRCCPLTAEEELAAEVAAHPTRIVERTVEEKAEKCKTVGITGAGAGTTTTITTSPDSPPGTSPTSATLTSPPQTASTPNKNHQHKLLRPVSLPPNVPDTVSPHHHRRHRNRDRNRKLAMQQVAEWIEREHAWNAATAAATNGGAGEKTATGTGAAAPGGTGNGAAGGVGSGAGAAEQQQRVIVQRHEHHHVHEHHHHHHYHHYHET